MTEEIDIKKLTNDAFDAIDALFTDEEDIFSEKNEKQPDDFELIQESMLALDWECSDKNIKKFIDLLNKITPKYSGKHNQDMLKMLMSIIRYLEKSKDKALPETHQVMVYIVKTFKTINQDGVNEATIKQEKNNAYNKVLELKSKIVKIKSEVPQEIAEQYQEQYLTSQSAPSTSVLQSTPSTSVLESAPSISVSQSAPSQSLQSKSEPIENSKIIVSILARIELFENRLASIDAQNIQLKQKIDELTYSNQQINQQFNNAIANKINELEIKIANKIHELSMKKDSFPTTSNIDSNIDELSGDIEMDNLSFADLEDGENKNYNEINFDGIDFDEMTSDTDILNNSSSIKMGLNEASLNEVAFDEVGLDEIGLDDALNTVEHSGSEIDFDQVITDNIGQKVISDNNILFEEITTDDIEYEEITLNDLQYDNNLTSGSNAGNQKQQIALIDQTILTSQKTVEMSSNVGGSNLGGSNLGGSNINATMSGNLEDTPKHVRCFKIENQIIALPDDKIYNIYKIPSKLTKTIHNRPLLAMGEFTSLFQNLSNNMKGHLKSVSNSTLKKMNVDVHLLTNKDIQYKMAILCSIDDKVSILPVTNIVDNRTHIIIDVKYEKNSFSNYNISIVNIGTIPFVPLCQRPLL